MTDTDTITADELEDRPLDRPYRRPARRTPDRPIGTRPAGAEHRAREVRIAMAGGGWVAARELVTVTAAEPDVERRTGRPHRGAVDAGRERWPPSGHGAPPPGVATLARTSRSRGMRWQRTARSRAWTTPRPRSWPWSSRRRSSISTAGSPIGCSPSSTR